MTATCTLCGEILTAVADVRGPQATLQHFGNQFGIHVRKKHADQFKTILQVMGVAGVGIQGLVLFSHLKSEDADFLEQIRQIREVVDKACAQKEVVTVIAS